MVGFGRRLLAAMVVLCLIVPMIGSLAESAEAAAAAKARRPKAEPVIDIASIALRPNDLDVEGYTIAGGQMLTVEDQAAEIGVSPDDLRELGSGRFYFESVGATASDESPCIGQVISTWIYEFADQNGAEAMLSDSINVVPDPSWELIDDDVAIGDGGALFDAPAPSCEDAQEPESLLAKQRTSDDECDDCDDAALSPGIQVAFVMDNLVIHVWIFNNPDTEAIPAFAYELTEENVLDLGEIAAEKAEAALDGDVAGLEPMVLRLGDGETVYGSKMDEYLRLDGVDFRFDGETDDEFEERTGRFGDATDVYQLAQSFDDADGEFAYITNTFYLFVDEDAASDWMTETEERLGENPYYDDVEEIELDVAYGDESIAFAHDDVNFDTENMRVYARYGSLVVVFNVGMTQGMDEEILTELMDVQAECVEAGACATPVPFPGL